MRFHHLTPFYFFYLPLERRGGFLEVRGSHCASGANRFQDTQPLLHPGGRLPVHRSAFQQWRDGQRGETQIHTNRIDIFLLMI